MKLKKFVLAIVHVAMHVILLLWHLSKRLYKWIKSHLSWGVRTLSKEEITDEYYSIRKEHFLTEALIYFVGSAYVMEGSQEQVSSISFLGKSVPWFYWPPAGIFVAALLFFVSLLLLYLSFNDRPLRLAEIVQNYTSGLRAIPLLVFTIEWIRSFATLANKGISTWFVTPYFFVGLLLLFLITAQQIFEICRYRRKKRLARSKSRIHTMN